MTKKRFIIADRWIKDNYIEALLNIDFNTITDVNLCCDLLNQIEKEKRNNGKLASKLLEENRQLKQQHRKLQIDFNDACIITHNLKEKVLDLEDENEQLKQQLNYIQNSISEHIKHQKTELGQKALKEIIEDYNEWLLGHKRLRE